MNWTPYAMLQSSGGGDATAFESITASIRTLAGTLWTLEGAKALEGPLLTTVPNLSLG